MLGDHGCTKIEKSEDDKLKAFWSRSPLAAKTWEQDTAIESSEKGTFSYQQFCPEVAYDSFGIFATSFSRYANGDDIGLAHKNAYFPKFPGKRRQPAGNMRENREVPQLDRISHDDRNNQQAVIGQEK